jgi:hypothetical protein
VKISCGMCEGTLGGEFECGAREVWSSFGGVWGSAMGRVNELADAKCSALEFVALSGFSVRPSLAHGRKLFITLRQASRDQLF